MVRQNAEMLETTLSLTGLVIEQVQSAILSQDVMPAQLSRFEGGCILTCTGWPGAPQRNGVPQYWYIYVL